MEANSHAGSSAMAGLGVWVWREEPAGRGTDMLSNDLQRRLGLGKGVRNIFGRLHTLIAYLLRLAWDTPVFPLLLQAHARLAFTVLPGPRSTTLSLTKSPIKPSLMQPLVPEEVA